MARKILILSASVGAGHLRAAEALELAIRELDGGVEVTNEDVLNLTTAGFRNLYRKSYLELVNRAPRVFGYLYDAMDGPSKKKNPKRERLRILLERLNMGKLLKKLGAEKYDLVLNTHFLPAEIIASRRRKGKLETPHFVVTTDFDTHRVWAAEPAERYFTATEEGAAYLAALGVEPGRISVTGIPIHPVFSVKKRKQQCRAEHGLAGDVPVILQLAGGFGVGPIEEIARSVLETAIPVQLVVVAGRNEKARSRLEGLSAPGRHRLKVLGYTDRMDELMAAADLVLSKPGGLTSSESLARGTPMAIINPIPGQEAHNSDYLLESGAAVKINSTATLAHKIERLLGDGKRMSFLKRNAARLGRPKAAYEIAEAALKY
ncbi:MAG: glycosyltransferase [Planctomycetes bacterium]|nr:glycosyltransferase [Planctomycetota bacterium]